MPPSTFHRRALLRARPLFTRTATLFVSAVCERIRGQTPPADFCNCMRRTGTASRALVSSQGRRRRPSSFSDASRSLPCGSGERAASRTSSDLADPGAGCSRLRGFARPRYLPGRVTSVGFRRRSSVAIDVHGSLDRVKDVSSGRERHGGLRVECVWLGFRTLTTFPSSASKGHPLSPVRIAR